MIKIPKILIVIAIVVIIIFVSWNYYFQYNTVSQVIEKDLQIGDTIKVKGELMHIEPDPTEIPLPGGPTKYFLDSDNNRITISIELSTLFDYQITSGKILYGEIQKTEFYWYKLIDVDRVEAP